ncbi:hypothetical protein GGI11_005510 [Coemansia sp. RSA 2049]|nr:hypothetical protein GGI11_005510 [Coemansia sp. RSA 2049]KAJ2516854.1 hypothetical protein H4217_004327 [Coemansia sp. RSA 1939]
MAVLGIAALSAIHATANLEVTIATAVPQQIPATFHGLSRDGDSAGSIMLTKRIASVRAGDNIHVGISFLRETDTVPDLSDIVAAIYSASDGSLVHVLDRKLAEHATSMHNTTPLGLRSIPLCIPTDGLLARKPFEMYKLALIVPERDLSGVWTRYSAATMLFAYDSTS